MRKQNILFAFIILAMLVSSCEREVFTGPPDTPPATNGKVFVDSEPQGAKIFLNKQNYGSVTPDTLIWLDEVNYMITLESELFQDTSFLVRPIENSVINLFVDYLANPNNYASIRCFSEPDNALIYLNDSCLNINTPDTIMGLYPGDYEVKFTYPEHRADSLDLFVRGSEYGDVNISLVDTSIYVAYTKTNSGMSSNLLSSVVIDHEGTIWTGTKDRGLVKFKSDEWTRFDQTNSLIQSNNVSCLAVDNDNNLWVGTTQGLSRYDGIDWLNFSFLLPHEYVSAITFDSEGNGWFGTQGGLVKWDGYDYTVYRMINSGLSDNFITSLAADGTEIWIGTNAFGINHFDGTNWTVYNKMNCNMQGDGVLSAFVDHNGEKWFDILPMPLLLEYGGLVVFDGATWQAASVGEEMNYRKIYWIMEDENYNKWFGTKAGLAMLDTEGNVSIFDGLNSGIPSYQVNNIQIDNNNNLWLATNGGGLIKFKKNKL
ncbi:two-component regulator propeller domain-containing protein [Bacteroidota bacterium]